MSREKDVKPAKEPVAVREARLAAAMRENLKRRKQQQRERSTVGDVQGCEDVKNAE